LDLIKDKEMMATSQGTSSSGATRHKNLIPVLICLALAILTVITFWSLKDCGFINLDDTTYVYENAYVQSGLNWNSIGQAFSSELVGKSSNWHPLTWLSLMLDYQIFGLNPFGYHLINLLFHVMNTILLFLIFLRMTKKLWPSAFVAALFAIHPLHVESVAWIAERKDVLSTFFFMLTLGAYSYYVEHPRLRRYFFVLLFFILGLMAKPMLVTLPFVLLLLDYWPLQRFQEIKPDHKVQTEVFKSVTSDKQKKKSKKKPAVKETLEVKKSASSEYKWSLIYPLFWEKVPLFVLAILSSIVTYIAQQKGGAVQSIEALPLGVRIGNAFISYIAYIGKMIWPSNLAVFYPYPGLLVPWQVFGSVILLIAVTLLVIWRAKRSPYLATGWLWYIGALVPVIGIVQVGSQAMADRYTYIPLIGISVLMIWGISDLARIWRFPGSLLSGFSVMVVTILIIISWKQAALWQNDIILFEHALKVTSGNYLAHNNLGIALYKIGKNEEALFHHEEALRINPASFKAHFNMANILAFQGKRAEAIYHYEEAIKLHRNYLNAHRNLGTALALDGRFKEAIEHYKKAIEIDGSDPTTYYNLGMAFAANEQADEAINQFKKALNIKPDFPEVYNDMGKVFAMHGRIDEAMGCFRKALLLKPNFSAARHNLDTAMKSK
jgi:protein O-mannosyl-transferase